ncbi:hypothetical protein VC83_03766 [Pseudogymnoascus destructans]|uniref:Golgi to ER traffic-protein n=2 Tax=Pseudogymnoascus destructans TaxID=655981 RepID=L8G3L3_PSED2|nr:uncharacterized protein VC83_03766 [Pseudogymnoascus destructans]ELR07717.1 hypothetical protein GMDG_02739 [Pseudogymnoascus destructans 20631-21]OAF59665.1 hypothetical protein VC83_03766 [Pseudogymnoascus destructans]
MADTPPTTSSPGGTPSSSASEQARIRRERREAKIKAGGTSRLNKITGLGGGLQRDIKPAAAVPQVASVSHADPDEVDISEHFYEPPPNIRPQNAPPNPNRPYPGLSSDPSQLDDQALRAMMLGFPPPNGSSQPQSNPFGGPPNPFAAMGNPDGTGDPANDPMMAMLQQMMGGEPGAMPSFPGLPPMGFPGNDANGAPAVKTSAYIWRIVHAIFALGFGLYIAFTTEFGRKADRLNGMESEIIDLRAFYVFATVEAILQGTRFIFDRGQDSQTGIIGTVLRFLPQPFGGYLRMFMNYRSIWTTTSADTLVVVFVLVAANHWRISNEDGSGLFGSTHGIKLA